ncbi:MAG: FAD-dependent oxidoreductase [Planctomycetaceae bacterium]
MSSGLTRRELLSIMLGAPAAAMIGCQPRALPSKGELLAPDYSLGHRLRDGMDLDQVAATHKHKVVIVGGGVAGLAAAWRLRREGVTDFVVLELERHAGGTAHSGKSEVIGYPWGAHYVPVPTKENPGLIALFDEMGLLEGTDEAGNPIAAEQHLCRDPQERVFHNGKWYEGLYPHVGATEEDLKELESFRAEMNRFAGLRDEQGRRYFTIPSAKCGDAPELRELDNVSFADWMQSKGWRSERLRWYADYACRDDYGMMADQTSAWAGLFYFASRIPEPGVRAQPFLTWPEGNGRIVNHITQQMPGSIRTGHMVCRIESNDDSVSIKSLNVESNSIEEFVAERVVFAAPQFVAPYIVEGLRDEQPWRGKGFQYGSWMVANLHLTDRPANNGFPLAWDNVSYGSRSLGYVVATHQKGMDHGSTVLTYYYPFCDENVAERRQLLLDMNWEEWADVILTDMHQVHADIRRLVQRIDIMRWGHAMVRPRPGFVFNPSRVRAKERFKNVHFANTDLSAMALMEEAWHHGLRASEEILTEMNATFDSLLG